MEIEKISEIARLEISKEEGQELEKEIRKILEKFSVVEKINFENSSVLNDGNFRNDENPENFDNVKGIFLNFSKTEEDFLSVPRNL